MTICIDKAIGIRGNSLWDTTDTTTIIITMIITMAGYTICCTMNITIDVGTRRNINSSRRNISSSRRNISSNHLCSPRRAACNARTAALQTSPMPISAQRVAQRSPVYRRRHVVSVALRLILGRAFVQRVADRPGFDRSLEGKFDNLRQT